MSNEKYTSFLLAYLDSKRRITHCQRKLQKPSQWKVSSWFLLVFVCVPLVKDAWIDVLDRIGDYNTELLFMLEEVVLHPLHLRMNHQSLFQSWCLAVSFSFSLLEKLPHKTWINLMCFALGIKALSLMPLLWHSWMRSSHVWLRVLYVLMFLNHSTPNSLCFRL